MPYAEGRIYNDADSHFMENQGLAFPATPIPRFAARWRRWTTMAGGKATEKLVDSCSPHDRAAQEGSGRDGARRGQHPGAQELACAGRLRPRRAQARARPAGLQPPVGFHRQLHASSSGASSASSGFSIPEVLYGGARAHNRGDRGVLLPRPADARGRLRAAGRSGTGGARDRGRRARGMRGILGPRGAAADHVADPSGHGPGVGHAPGPRRPLRAPSGRRSAVLARRASRKTARRSKPAARSARRHPLQGLHGRALRRRGVHVRDDSGRRAGEVSRACAAA